MSFDLTALLKARNLSGSAFRQMGRHVSHLEKRMQTLNRAGRNLTTLGLGGGLTSLYPTMRGIKSAATFEQSLIDIKKVLPDGMEGNFSQVEESINRLSMRIPLARRQLASFFEEGARSGVSDTVEGLTKFADLAATTSFAFKIPAAEAATKLARLKSSLGLTHDELKDNIAAINILGDNMATNERKLLEFQRRIGPLAKSLSGVSKEIMKANRLDVLAIGAGMTAAGVQEDVAATGLRNLLVRVASGSRAEKPVVDGIKALGFDPDKFANELANDFAGGAKKLFKAINKVQDKTKKAALLRDILGMRAIDANSPLIGNLGLLTKSLELLEDPTKRQNRLFKIFEMQAGTMGASFQLMRNSWGRLRDDMVQRWRPEIMGATKGITSLMEAARGTPFSGLLAGTIALTSGLSALALPVGSVMLGISAMGLAMPGLTMAAGGLATAFAALTGPIGLTAIAVGSATYALYTYRKEIKDFIFGVEADAKRGIKAQDHLLERSRKLAAFLSENNLRVAMDLAGVDKAKQDNIISGIKHFFDKIKNEVRAAGSTFKTDLASFSTSLNDLFSVMGNKIAYVFESGGRAFKRGLSQWGELLQGPLDMLKKPFESFFEYLAKIKDKFASLFENPFTKLGNFFEKLGLEKKGVKVPKLEIETPEIEIPVKFKLDSPTQLKGVPLPFMKDSVEANKGNGKESGLQQFGAFQDDDISPLLKHEIDKEIRHKVEMHQQIEVTQDPVKVLVDVKTDGNSTATAKVEKVRGPANAKEPVISGASGKKN